MAALMAGNNAGAAVVYFDNTHALSWSPNNGSSTNMDWDIDGSGSAEARLGRSGQFSHSFLRAGASFSVFISTPSFILSELSFGRMISVGLGGQTFGLEFQSGLSTLDGHRDDFDGLVGFRFKPGDTTFYGWAEIKITTVNVVPENKRTIDTFEILRWAYEDSGAGIRAGHIPEPSPTGLAALALGAAARRRRRADGHH